MKTAPARWWRRLHKRAIIDSACTEVVEYKYDAWGKPIAKTGSLASTLGTLNPFRYRGYVYDEETGLYYLRSRYFSNEKCRFVNADSHLADNNLFSYCINNPTDNLDSNGQEHLSISSEGASGFYGIFYIVVGALNSIGCEHSASFLLNSLSPSAKTTVYTNDDSIVESIKNSNAFQTKVRSIIDEQKYGVKDSFTFPPSELDLFGALHNVDIVVDKKANMDGSVQYNIQIDDVYNYEIEKMYEKKSMIRDSIFYTLVMCLNNVAFSAQAYGIINEYEVKILFSLSDMDVK